MRFSSILAFSRLAFIFVAILIAPRAAHDERAQGIVKLILVIDDIGAGKDFNKYYELFRVMFGAPKP